MSDAYYPPRRSHGCLWGCLGLAVILLLPFLLLGGFGSWFLSGDYRDDPALRAAAAIAGHSLAVQRLLGADARVTGVEGNAFSFASGLGSRHAALLRLEGSRGSGTLTVTSHKENGQAKIDSLILTGPDEQRYDLLQPALAPPAASTHTI
jgi:hypothetical protein